MNLNIMTVSELRKLAAQFGIAGRSTMKKAELIAALSADEFAGSLEIMGGIAELEAEEREMNEIRAEIAAEAAYIEEGIEVDEADAAEQSDRASYYSGTVPCFERTTVDGIGYGCVKLGEHVEHNTALGAAWWAPVECVAITKYSAHEAFATAVFGGRSVGSYITKVRGRWALQYGSGHVIRAKTLGKIAKLWAKALGFHATAIDIDVMS